MFSHQFFSGRRLELDRAKEHDLFFLNGVVHAQDPGINGEGSTKKVFMYSLEIQHSP